MNLKEVGAIVQARLGSTRLPNKVLKNICDVPVIEHVVNHIEKSQFVNKIVVATTDKPQDDPIEEWANAKGIEVYRGSEDNVLKRFYDANTKFQFDHILRVTADCPLLTADVCDRLILEYFQGQYDVYHTSQMFAEGADCEIFSSESLARCYRSAEKRSDKEHVTLFMYNNPELFKIGEMQNGEDHSGYRFTLDEDKDFWVISQIFEGLYSLDAEAISYDGVVSWLKLNEQVAFFNSNIKRNEGLEKSLKQDTQ